MNNLILVRHGQSLWNKKKRFTGWADIDLTEHGKSEAKYAGELIKKLNIQFDAYFTSELIRASNSLNIILKVLNISNAEINKAWELNERHYGALTGLNKDEMKKKYGEEKIHEFRRSWDMSPDPLSRNNPYHPLNIEIYKDIPKDKIPDTESLKNTYERVVPYFENNIYKKLEKNIVVAAHGNSVRALCKYLFKLNEKDISKLEIPTGNPLLLEFNNKKILQNARYLDKKRAKDLIIFS